MIIKLEEGTPHKLEIIPITRTHMPKETQRKMEELGITPTPEDTYIRVKTKVPDFPRWLPVRIIVNRESLCLKEYRLKIVPPFGLRTLSEEFLRDYNK